MSTKKSAGSVNVANAPAGKVEVRIGIADSPRELTIDLTNSADEIEATVARALHEGSHVAFTDEKGRRLIVPAGKVGFIEVSARAERKVGFGTN